MKVFREKYYNCAASDFDGTLIRSDGTISKETVEAINAFVEHGGSFCICTGRMTSSIVQYCREMGLKGYVISYNGAEIVDVQTGEKIFKNHVENEVCVKLLEYAEDNGYNAQIYPGDIIAVNKIQIENELYSRMSRVKVVESGSERLSEVFKRNGMTSGKVLFYIRQGKKDLMMEQIKQIVGDGYNVVNSNPQHIDVMKKGSSKGESVLRFVKMMGKDVYRLMVFGDEMNDKSMLDVAGLAVLTENGNELLKRMVDIIAPSCDEDGVRKVLEKYGV